MGDKYLTQEQMLDILNESDDPDNGLKENEHISFYDYDNTPNPYNIYIKHSKTRTDKEQEDEIIYDAENPINYTEQFASVIAGVMNDGTMPMAENVKLEIIDEFENVVDEFINVTNPIDVRWMQSEFTKTKIEYNYSEKIEMVDEAPGKYFMKYFTEQLFETMVRYTNIYGMQKSESFHLTDINEMKRFIGVHLFIGCTKFPQIEMYWNKLIGIDTVIRTMTRDRFWQLRSNFHVVNNLEIPYDNNDAFYKVRPILNAIRNRCLEIPLEENLSIDEQIIPFKDAFSVMDYMKGKLSPWGLKLYLLCGKSGQPYDFIIYQESKTEISDYNTKRFGFGAAVVLHLIRRIKVPGHTIYFDNFFMSYNILEMLKCKGINAAGTAHINRVRQPNFMDYSNFKENTRGYIEEYVSHDNSISVVKWLDNKPVYLASNFIGKGDVKIVKQWDSSAKCYVDVPQPEIVSLFNAGMGGVVDFGQMIEYYRTFNQSKKWPLRVMTHFIDFACSACWIEYKKQMEKQNVPAKDVMDLFEFRLNVSVFLMKTNKHIQKRGRPPSSCVKRTFNPLTVRMKSEVRPSSGIRYDCADHLPMFNRRKEPTRCKFERCIYRSRISCGKCGVHLCLFSVRNCFLKFHKK